MFQIIFYFLILSIEHIKMAMINVQIILNSETPGVYENSDLSDFYYRIRLTGWRDTHLI